MSNNSNESIISKIDINTNIKEEIEFIIPINDLGSLLINYFQGALSNNEKINNSIKSFQNDFFLLKSIPENISNKVLQFNSELLEKIYLNDFILRKFFEKAKNLFNLMKEKKQNYSKNANSNYQIKLDYNKLEDLTKKNQTLTKENEKLKIIKENLEKEIESKTLKINNLELENYQLTKDEDLSYQKSKIEELNEEIKAITSEKEELEEILAKKGIKIIGGVEIELSKEDILEEYKTKISNLTQQNEILKDFSQKYQKLIESDIYGENRDLKNKLARFNEEEINSLETNYEKKLKENDDLKSKLSNNEKEINLLKEKNEILLKEIGDLNTKYKELERNYPNNEIINGLNNININNQISIDGVIDKLTLFIQENERLKRIISELNIKSIKRSCFENQSELEKIPEEEYNEAKMSEFAKKIDNYQNLSVDHPNVSEIIEKYRKLEFLNNIFNNMINKSKNLLKTEKNDKNLRNELSNILELDKHYRNNADK